MNRAGVKLFEVFLFTAGYIYTYSSFLYPQLPWWPLIFFSISHCPLHFSRPRVSYIASPLVETPGYWAVDSINAVNVDWSFSFSFISSSICRDWLFLPVLTIVPFLSFSIHSVLLSLMYSTYPIFGIGGVPPRTWLLPLLHAFIAVARLSAWAAPYIYKFVASDRSDSGGWQTTHRPATRAQRDCSLHIHQG